MNINSHLQPTQKPAAVDESVTMNNTLSPKGAVSRNRPENLEWLQDAGMGLFIHWSLDAQLGCVISHSLVGASEDYVNRFYTDLPRTLNPRFWDKSQVTQAVLDEEKKVMLAQMENDPKMAGKPEQVREKIVMGKLNKFYAENCLLQQDSVRADVFEGSVEAYIAHAAKELGGAITFKTAVRFEKGEGIEKKQENFADEIASLVKG